MKNNNNCLNILITSVGRRSYIVRYFKKELAGLGRVYVSNSSAYSPAFQVADDYVVTPLIYDENYISFLIDYCREKEINAIISLFDVDLPVLAENKSIFEQNGIRLVVSDYSVVDICNDKWKTYCFLTENGFKSPKTFISVDDAINALESGELEFPLYVKPRWGMGSLSVYEAVSVEELRVLYHKVERGIRNSYLQYESAADVDNCVIIQEQLRGQEYGLDIINNLNAEYQNTIVKKKIAMRSGETDCAVTVDDEKLKSLGETLSNKIKHIANLDVDVFVNDSGAYILEMNARFGGGYPFSHMAGVNLPKAIIAWLCGKEAETSDLEAKPDIVCQKDINLVYLK